MNVYSVARRWRNGIRFVRRRFQARIAQKKKPPRRIDSAGGRRAKVSGQREEE